MVGGAALSVAPTKFPREELQSYVFQASCRKDISSRVAARIRSKGLFIGEVEMVSVLDRGFCSGERILVVFLFPELVPRPLDIFAVVNGEVTTLKFHLPTSGNENDIASTIGSSYKEGVGMRLPSLPSSIPQLSTPKDTVKFPKPRGRLKKVGVDGSEKVPPATLIDVEVVSTWKEMMALSKELSNPYSIMTRARNVILLGKNLDFTYDCPDVIVEGEYATQIMARRLL